MLSLLRCSLVFGYGGGKGRRERRRRRGACGGWGIGAARVLILKKTCRINVTKFVDRESIILSFHAAIR